MNMQHKMQHIKTQNAMNKGVNYKNMQVQALSPVPTNCYQKDIMPTNGYTKPFVGINLAKNRIHGPQIFSTRKWT